MGQTAKEILELDDLARKIITIKKWNNLKLEIVEMTGEERDRALEAARVGEKKMNSELFAEQVILASVKDPDLGLPFFDVENIRLLNKKSWQAVEQIASAVFEINGLGRRAAEEVEKN